jgi:hypothetical protein
VQGYVWQLVTSLPAQGGLIALLFVLLMLAFQVQCLH